MNNWTGIGRLTKDVELRYTPSNIACATFDIAINNGKDKDGNERKADFIRCVLWDTKAENMAKYTHKGSQVAVEGSIKNDNYEDENGNKHYRTYALIKSVQYLDSKSNSQPLPTEPDYLISQSEENDPLREFEKPFNEIDDSDLPF